MNPLESALQDVVLEGAIVRLEPLRRDHLKALTEVGLDPGIWKWTVANVRTPDEMKEYVEDALSGREKGSWFPFVTIERASRTIVGSTRFGNFDPANHRIEIGWTWISPRWQRTAINTEAKFLMMRHAFENLHCVRVELKTNVLNTQSRNAMLRMGAKEEGILRRHMLLWNGTYRDSIYYSVLDNEWPEVKTHLRELLDTKYATK